MCAILHDPLNPRPTVDHYRTNVRIGKEKILEMII